METIRVADHFPRRPKPCVGVSEKFFGCFATKGEQPEGGDAEAGRRGLAECKKEMAAYDACMIKYAKGRKNKDETFFRVQEEYRASTLQAKQQQAKA